MEPMIHIHFVPHPDTGTIEPYAPQYAGMQGDHNAAYVTFLVPEALRGDPYCYRVEGTDGSGTFLTSRLLPLDQQGIVGLWLDRSITAAGGQAILRLVIAQTNGEEEAQTVHSFDARIYFSDTDNGTQKDPMLDLLRVLGRPQLESVLDGEADGSLRGVHAAEEGGSYALGEDAIALGKGTMAAHDCQTTVGRFNRQQQDALFVVGNGTDNAHRQDAFYVTPDGRAVVRGEPVTSKDVATKGYVDTHGGTSAPIQTISTPDEDLVPSDQKVCIPCAGSGKYGLVKVLVGSSGLTVGTNGLIAINPSRARPMLYREGTNLYINNNTGVLCSGEQQVNVTDTTSGSVSLDMAKLTNITSVQNDIVLTPTVNSDMDEAVCTWDFAVTMGNTAHTITLPHVQWYMGIAPAFSANSTVLVTLYRLNNTLYGNWTSLS